MTLALEAKISSQPLPWEATKFWRTEISEEVCDILKHSPPTWNGTPLVGNLSVSRRSRLRRTGLAERTDSVFTAGFEPVHRTERRPVFWRRSAAFLFFRLAPNSLD